ncbi:hypothetical protein FXO37_02650 [Capsicum annuum]|nr:hypothetical protein FXO37_02650 [Capsicum annuum]
MNDGSEFSRTVKKSLVAHNIAGLRPSKNIRLLEVEAGGPKRMRAAYRDFSDVICFDTTYLMNQWRMPFAFFIGVDHHNQSILLGCALLTSEDIKIYTFVFRNWLTAMGEIPPTTILTDQCESIKAAIREVMPNTVHRCESMHAFFDGYISGRSSLKQFVEQYEVALRVHVVRLPHCEIERHVDFNAVEGVEDLKNVLKACFKTYMAWKDDMTVPNVPDLDSNTDSTIVRSPREVCSYGRPRSTEIDLHVNIHAVKMLGDGDLDTMMYTKRDKAVKVGVEAGDGAIEVVEEVGCVVVEEVEAMIQTHHVVFSHPIDPWPLLLKNKSCFFSRHANFSPPN